MDATLPDEKILQSYYPQVVMLKPIEAKMPECVKIRQVIRAPISASKLQDSQNKNPEKHLQEIKRQILLRWIEHGKAKMLVICQMEVEEWLQERLPEEIRLKHFNAIAGLDEYRDVRLLMVIGRTQPGPEAPEKLGATVSGTMPEPVPETGKFTWYPQTRRTIRLRDGTGVRVYADQHPDDVVESVRWQICEAELVQAIGRGRGVNRTDETPLSIDLIFNTVLPVAVDEVVEWETPSKLIDTAVDGVMLTSPVDLVRVWPKLWPKLRSAERTVAEGVPSLPGFEEVTYQLVGPKMKPRVGHFDLNLIPAPYRWLEERLGPVVRDTKSL